MIMPVLTAFPALLPLPPQTGSKLGEIDTCLIGSAGFLLVCLIGWVFYERERSRRAHALIRATRRIAGGDFDVPLELQGGDDFALLGSAIGQMAQELRLRTKILRD
jgi:nitrate/nitrite-specific signal transduction histidine kinase